MRSLLFMLWILIFWVQRLPAQVQLIAGGAFRSSQRSSSSVGAVGLQVLPDREWSIGVQRKVGFNRAGAALGLLASSRWRSPFYELSKSLTYYPLKPHLATYRFESLQLFPFISISDMRAASSRLGWSVRVGPVFHFHAGNFISTTTARAVPAQTSFVLYRMRMQGHPMGIPFGRAQVGFSVDVLRRSKFTWQLNPFLQTDLGDRSRGWYQVVPDDPLYAAEGNLRNGKWSFGILCGFAPRR